VPASSRLHYAYLPPPPAPQCTHVYITQLISSFSLLLPAQQMKVLTHLLSAPLPRSVVGMAAGAAHDDDGGGSGSGAYALLHAAGLLGSGALRADIRRAPRPARKVLEKHSSQLGHHLSCTTRRWQRGEISNYDYLIALNSLAGRSFSDLTQYPVFPWVLRDYYSPQLDLNNPDIFRDLSKPMGAQGSRRAKQFCDRYSSLMDSMHEDSLTATDAFFYGTHYSCAGYVLNFLFRTQPFSNMASELQGGHFDRPDRLFSSIESAWRSASSENLQVPKSCLILFFYSYTGTASHLVSFALHTLCSIKSLAADISIHTLIRLCLSFFPSFSSLLLLY
jgi:hypothetical protein